MEEFSGFKYYVYLGSEKWKKISDAIKERDGYKCTMCGSTEDLQVHHITYAHIFHEEDHMEDLVTLCKKCHFGYHDFERKEKQRKEEERKEEYQRKIDRRADLISCFVEKYKSCDFAFGGNENLCKFDTIEKYWVQFCEGESECRYYKAEIRDIFRRFKIDAIQQLKANGLNKSDIIKSGIPRKWVDKYWEARKEGANEEQGFFD